jgi:alpha-beta hydrolase superfamily lysophospholipase
LDPQVTHRDGFFAAKDNLRLYWQALAPRAPRATVAVIHGYGDHSGRYGPLFEALVDHGFEVQALDYRGHGQADGRRGHVDHFSDYLDDLGLFLDRVVGGAPPDRKLFVVGHSHGALILARFLIERPRPVAGAVFCSPYLRLAIKPSPLKVGMARLVARLAPWIPFQSEIRIEQLSRDPLLRDQTLRDPLYNRTVTPGWFFESQAAQFEVLRRAGEIVAPSLVLAGLADSIADPAEMQAFHRNLGSADKELRTYPDAYHELFNELPTTRQRVLSDLCGWLAGRS